MVENSITSLDSYLTTEEKALQVGGCNVEHILSKLGGTLCTLAWLLYSTISLEYSASDGKFLAKSMQVPFSFDHKLRQKACLCNSIAGSVNSAKFVVFDRQASRVQNKKF